MSILRRKPQPDLQVEVTIRIEGGDDEAIGRLATDYPMPYPRRHASHRFDRTKADIDALPETEEP